MKIGALIVTTGLAQNSGVTILQREIGCVSAGQRMLAAFQSAGVSLCALVLDSSEKKAERQFSQTGVVLLHCQNQASFLEGVRDGLRFMHDKFDRIFVVAGDIPLFLPDTLKKLMESPAPIAVPVNNHVYGCPVLLSPAAVEAILGSPENVKFEKYLSSCGLSVEYVPVKDSGVILRGDDMSHRKKLIQLQNQQMMRPVVEVSLSNAVPLYDSKLALLLHLIEDTSSVRDACDYMGISYSAAWSTLNQAEDNLGYPLITRNRGGSAGSGSVLTEKGRKLMDAYDRFFAHLNREALRLYSECFDIVEK